MAWLNPLIIDNDRRREQERRDEGYQLPLEAPAESDTLDPETSPPAVDRGVVIIEFQSQRQDSQETL